MSENELKIQEPGTLPIVDDAAAPIALDHAKLEALAAGNVGDLAEALDALTELELEQLSVFEAAGKNRSTALGAIAREQERRLENAGNDNGEIPSPAAIPDIAGDPNSYARMRAAEIDNTKLERPVLTLDGWLLPAPKAQPE